MRILFYDSMAEEPQELANPGSLPASAPAAPRLADGKSGSAVNKVVTAVLIILIAAVAAYLLLGKSSGTTVPTLNSSTTSAVTAGGNLVLKASASGGSGPYTYSFHVINPLTGKAVASANYSSPLTTNTFTWHIPGSSAAASVVANVLVTYSNGQTDASNYTKPIAIHENYSALTKNLYGMIQFSNNQSNVTGNNFQQLLSFNPSTYAAGESNDLGNIRFYLGSDELHSWCESGCTSYSTNATFWILVPTGIMARGNVIVTVRSLPAGTEYDGVYAGEAPQLSCNNPANTISGCTAGQYGKYDNGKAVFNFYDNFAGNTLNPRWNTSGSLSIARVNNGINGSYEGELYTGIPQTNSIALDSYETIASPYDQGEYVGFSKVLGSGYPTAIYALLVDTYYTGAHLTFSSGLSYLGNDQNFVNQTSPPSGSYVLTEELSSSKQIFMYNYGHQNLTTNAKIEPVDFNQIGLRIGSWANNNGHFRWVRTRAYPPNGVMPTAKILEMGVYSNTTGRSSIEVVQHSTELQNTTLACSQGESPNYYLDQCQASIGLPQSQLASAVNSYLSSTNTTGCEIMNTSGTYYGANALELAR